MVMLTLNDAAQVAARYAKDGYGRNFLYQELEQKGYCFAGKPTQALSELAQEVNMDTILDHIRRGDLGSFLDDLRANMLGEIARLTEEKRN